MEDGQTDDQQGNARENLEPAFLGFERHVAWGSEVEHERNVYRPYIRQYVARCMTASSNAKWPRP
jgi:hypothetical protein